MTETQVRSVFQEAHKVHTSANDLQIDLVLYVATRRIQHILQTNPTLRYRKLVAVHVMTPGTIVRD